MMKPASLFIRWFLNAVKRDAVTLPPFGIYCRASVLGDMQLAAHEQVHWEQYQKMGFWRYYLTYLWYQIRYGYDKNPMEVEAKK
jgi:hypothetical protein